MLKGLDFLPIVDVQCIQEHIQVMWLTLEKSLFLLAFSPRKATEGGFDVEMMGLIGAGNNPMVGITVAVAVAIEEASK